MSDSKKTGRPKNPGLNGFYLSYELLENLDLDSCSPREFIRERLLQASRLYKSVKDQVKLHQKDE